jgi:hypothetical protein
MECLTIVLSLPHKSLSPNSRSHWAQRGRAGSRHREEARVTTLAALLDAVLGVDWSSCTIEPFFYHATAHKRDRDNAGASLKWARDGVADAFIEWGVAEDDSGFIPLPAKLSLDKEDPRVELVVCASR